MEKTTLPGKELKHPPPEAQISTRLHFLYVVRANTYTSIVKTIRNNGLIGGIGALIKQAKTGLVKQEGGDISQEYFDQAVKRLNDLFS